jgi:hypothetical protein
MGNNSRSGSLLRTVLGWAIVVIVAIVAFKIVLGVIAGLFQFVFALALLALIAYAVIWALRKL